MAIRAQINPTLFDKLVSDSDLSGLRATDNQVGGEISVSSLRFYTTPRLDAFKESSLELTVRRDLAWILNTTNLGAAIDLEPYPEVQSSVLNFGVPDLAGKTMSTRAIRQRADEIEAAIRAFEPRIGAEGLAVEPRSTGERENAITYVITGDITAAVNALPIRLVTDVETDTGAVTVRD